MSTKKIYFLLFGKNNISTKRFMLGSSNPGVGGTQFTIITTVLKLSLSAPEWQFILVNSGPVNIGDAPANFSQTFFDSPQDFVQDFIQGSSSISSSILVASVAVIQQVSIDLTKQISHKLIAWSHHPFDRDLKKLTSLIRIRSVICVGIYQYFSNIDIGCNLSYIQNLFILPTLGETEAFDIRKEKVNIVYLGALIPSKGFLEVAKTWNHLKLQIPDVVLHVIGSSATYGLVTESDLVPAEKYYATQILEHIPEKDIHNGKVIFYGNLGKEKFDVIRRCDFAILNPTGQSEAFPASPIEIMSCGVPVIASDDYGMSDCMRFFPELAINGFRDIPNKVDYLIRDSLRYQEFQQRSVAVAQWFNSQNNQVVVRWLRLLNAIFIHENLQLPPIAPFYGSRLKLWLRRDVRPKFRAFKPKI